MEDKKIKSPIALDKTTGEVVWAETAKRGHRFACFCHEPRQELILRRGRVRAPHFAHKKKFKHRGESDEHKIAKAIVAKQLRDHLAGVSEIKAFYSCKALGSATDEEIRALDKKTIPQHYRDVIENQSGAYLGQCKYRTDVSYDIASRIKDGYRVVEEEYLSGGRFKPDVSVVNNFGEIIFSVEVHKTHEVKEFKRYGLRVKDLAFVEVNAEDIINQENPETSPEWLITERSTEEIIACSLCVGLDVARSIIYGDLKRYELRREAEIACEKIHGGMDETNQARDFVIYELCNYYYGVYEFPGYEPGISKCESCKNIVPVFVPYNPTRAEEVRLKSYFDPNFDPEAEREARELGIRLPDVLDSYNPCKNCVVCDALLKGTGVLLYGGVYEKRLPDLMGTKCDLVPYDFSWLQYLIFLSEIEAISYEDLLLCRLIFADPAMGDLRRMLLGWFDPSYPPPDPPPSFSDAGLSDGTALITDIIAYRKRKGLFSNEGEAEELKGELSIPEVLELASSLGLKNQITAMSKRRKNWTWGKSAQYKLYEKLKKASERLHLITKGMRSRPRPKIKKKRKKPERFDDDGLGRRR